MIDNRGHDVGIVDDEFFNPLQDWFAEVAGAVAFRHIDGNNLLATVNLITDGNGKLFV